MKFPEERVLIDHNNEETLPLVLESGCWAGHSIYPNTKMDEQRMVALVKKYGTERIIVNSAADWGVSDPLKVPKTVAVMRQQGVADDTIQTIVWDNPVAFFAQSGRLDVAGIEARPAIDRARSSRATPCCAASRCSRPAVACAHRGPQRRRADARPARRRHAAPGRARADGGIGAARARSRRR